MKEELKLTHKDRMIGLTYSLYHQMCSVEYSYKWISEIHDRYKDDPDYKQAVKELALTDWVSKYGLLGPAKKLSMDHVK